MSSSIIGLIDVDGHGKRKKWGATVYPNLALCKLSAWHKARGDVVEWYSPFGQYDILYMAKVFNFTPDYSYPINNADKIIKGGTGYDIASRLPDDVDKMQPDYSIYPYIPSDHAYGFLTRGCPNRCPWCVVPRKEGAIRPYMDVDEIAVDGRTKLVLMDNNILAAGDYAIEQMYKIIRKDYRVDFNQAMDARLVNDEYAKLIAKIKWIDGRIKFGCDTPAQVHECERAITMIESHGFKGEVLLYTMLGTTGLDECYRRTTYWRDRLLHHRRSHKGCATYAYCQPFRDVDNPNNPIPQWQRDLTQWCNKRMLYTTIDFKEFKPRKGFRCKQYFK